MALLLTPNGSFLHTTHLLQVPQAYVRIAYLDYDKDAKTVVLRLEYFVSEAAAKAEPRAEPFCVRGLPATVTCPNPLDVLANAGGRPAYAVAYDVAAAALRAALGNIGTVTDAP